MNNKHLVAVYGSLRAGLHNHRLLDNEESTQLGTFKTPPIYKLFSLGGFPGLHKDGTTEVTVEVYEVSEDVFKSLDRLEGYYPDRLDYSMYVREQIETPFGDAWIYFYNSDRYSQNKMVESGDWTEYMNLKSA